MVTIVKGNHTLKVTAGAYESLYKSMGYTVIGARGSVKDSRLLGSNNNTLKGSDESEDTEDSTDECDLEEKPLSELSPRELRQYAVRLGIDTDGMSKKEIRAAIRELEE